MDYLINKFKNKEIIHLLKEFANNKLKFFYILFFFFYIKGNVTFNYLV